MAFRGKRIVVVPLVAPLLFFQADASSFAQFADGVLVNGNVVTMDPARPHASAVAWANGKIISVGSDGDVLKLANDKTKIIDLTGRLAIPGFIESHGHFSSMGFAKMNLELRDDTSWDSIIAKVAAATTLTPEGHWIVGRGWHQEKWTSALHDHVEGYPLHDALSAVSPRHPVLLTHASGHLAIVNAEAMRLAEIEKETKNPEGGEILRDEDGCATGVLRETAQNLVSRLYDREADAPAAWNRAVELASAECLANGITSFQDAGSTLAEIDRYRDLAERGELSVRLWVMVRDDMALLQRRLNRYRLIDLGDGYLTVRAVKLSIDGALGSHGAWLLEPYDDLISSTGLNTTPMSEMETVAKLAAQEDFQLCVHAIGDRANQEVLNLYERIFTEFPQSPGKSRRWRIEHAQHLYPDDIPRFAKLGVIAAMQAVHCTSDAPFVGPRLGQRRAATGAYRWRDLLDSGAIICNGTDAPVESVNPIESFYASVTRRTKNGLVFFGDQIMTREEALRSYTLHAAYAAFEEETKGSLEVGKVPDIVVLSRNIMTCDESEILAAKIDLTIVNGEPQYRRLAE